MFSFSEFQLPSITPYKRAKLLSVAKQVLESQQAMTSKKGKNILHYTLQRKRKHLRMDHYPKGDRIDKQTGAQYFYHCHRENYDSAEHGHFHCYLRYKNIPQSIKPKFVPDLENDSPMTHLVAIAMNCYGQPIRLFTVNRWVSSEIWYDARYSPRFIKRFKMTLSDDPYWQILDKWVEGMIHLFAPQISWVLKQRDQILNKDPSIYNDKSKEEISEINIDINQQIQWIIQPPKV